MWQDQVGKGLRQTVDNSLKPIKKWMKKKKKNSGNQQMDFLLLLKMLLS